MSFDKMNIESNSKFLEIEPGKPKDIHILSTEPVKQVIHGFGQDKVSCSGTGCHLCEEGATPSQRWIVNVYDRTDNKVKLYEFGPMVAKQIKAIAEMLGESQQTVHDIDLRIKKEGSGMNTEYTVLQKPMSGIIPDDLMLHKIL